MIITIIKGLMDWSQVILAVAIAVYGFHILVGVDRKKRQLSDNQLQNLYKRERCRFSVQVRTGIIVAFCLYFALIQFTWTLDRGSDVLDLSEDFRWFAAGILNLLILLTELRIYKRLWSNWTRFREEDSGN